MERLPEHWTKPPRYWNVWWTLTVITLAFTLAVVVLEALGVFGDFGLDRLSPR